MDACVVGDTEVATSTSSVPYLSFRFVEFFCRVCVGKVRGRTPFQLGAVEYQKHITQPQRHIVEVLHIEKVLLRFP